MTIDKSVPFSSEQVTITIEGNITGSAVETLQPLFEGAVSRCTSGAPVLSIDLRKTEIVDSRGLGLLIRTYKELVVRKNGRIQLVNVSPDLMTIFKNVNLDRHFELIPQTISSPSGV